MKRWLILGCGYVGSALAERLLAVGVEVWAVRRSAGALDHLQSSGLKVVPGDLAGDGWHAAVPDDFSVVVQCASASGGGLAGYEQAYVRGNRSLLRWAEAGARVGKILYTSSTTVYGQADGSWITEDQAGGELTETASLIWESEQILRQSCLRGQVAVMRLAGIYGPGRHYLLDLVKNSRGPVPGRGDYFLNLIHRDDIVTALLAAGEGSWSGPLVVNVADDQPFTREEVVRWIAETTGQPFPGFDPDSTTGRRLRVNARGDFPNRRISNALARQILGWRPRWRDFREGFGALLRES